MECRLLTKQEEFCKQCCDIRQYWNLDDLIKDIENAAKFCNSDCYYDGLTFKDIENDDALKIKYEKIASQCSDNKFLPRKDICYLHLLLCRLCGYEEIERITRVPKKTLKDDFTKRIYKYIKFLTGVKKIDHPFSVKECLEPKYRTGLSLNDSIQNKSLKLQVTIEGSLDEGEAKKIYELLKQWKK